MMDFEGRNNLTKVALPWCKVAVLGGGISGLAVMEFLSEKREDNQFSLYDDNSSERIHKNLESINLRKALFGGGLNENIEKICNADVIVLSPGIPRRHVVIENAIKSGVQIVNELEIAAAFLPEADFIAVTGSNGKSSVVSLLEHIFTAEALVKGKTAKSVFLGGNFGAPLIHCCLKNAAPPETVILELSSYQLETITKIALSAGAITNLAPDHLDRYSCLGDYYAAKLKICQLLKSQNNFFLNADDSNTSDFLKRNQDAKLMCLNAKNFFTAQDLNASFRFQINKKHFPGRHHLENIACALKIAESQKVSHQSFQKGLDSFKPLSHRQDLFYTIGEHQFWDDSKATNIAASIASLQSMQARTHLILGGVGKGESYKELRQICETEGHFIYAIGEEMPILEVEFKEYPTFYCSVTIEQALQEIKENLKDNDAVLLAPACASFDQFENYKVRGQFFQDKVHEYFKVNPEIANVIRKV